MDSHPPEGDDPPPPKDESTESTRHKGRFRFKSRSSRNTPDHHTSHSTRHHKRHHSSPRHNQDRPSKSRRRHKHRHTTRSHPSASPSPSPNTHNDPNGPISPSAAFRESLFDALGDDEGAAYWESVYGQPIHTYTVPEVPKGPGGELEQMSEEEYASYVRARMWERTREGMLEEQERLRAERRRAKAREEQRSTSGYERRAFVRAMEDSLRRGAERKRRKGWEGVWRGYLGRWEEIAGVLEKKASELKESKEETETDGNSKSLRNLLFWPVESARRRDVSPEAVREFMRHAPAPADLLSTLKEERVRWHPDKMQHRYGGLGIDEVVMRSVTEVFQIVDQMWNEERERSGG